MARVRAAALALLLLAALVPAAEAGTREDPNVVDATGEGDPRTDGATPLPPALDIHSAWFEPSQWTVEVHLRMHSLLLPPVNKPGPIYNDTYAEVQFGVNETVFTGGLCHNVTRAYVDVTLSSLDLYDGGGQSRIGCILEDGTRSHETSWDGGGPHAQVGSVHVQMELVNGEIIITVPRAMQFHYGDSSVQFQHSITLGDPKVVVYQQPGLEPYHCTHIGGCPLYDGETVVYDTAGPGRNQTI